MASDLSENEIRFREFYFSGESETTPNFPLIDHTHPGVIPGVSENGEFAVYLQESVAAPGQMLMVENTDVSCACLRHCSPRTEMPSAHAPTTVLSPPVDRIPLEAHNHLAHKFAKTIPQWEGVNSENQLMRYLDARPHPPAVVPVDLSGGLETFLENRGPWNEVEEGVEKTLDAERVWNIIAKNAICYKVSRKSREDPSQMETCEFWGMWIKPSFINHSCIPNCHAMRVGDAIIIRAAKAMAAGEELTLPYFDIFQPLCKRELAAQRWGFRCECPRCAFERSIGKPYAAIQEQIGNLEQQIQKLWAWKDVKTRTNVATRLLQKLGEQIAPIMELQKRLKQKSQDQKSEDNEIPYIEQDQVNYHVAWIRASLIETLIAPYAIAVYKCQIMDNKGRAGKVEKLRIVIRSVLIILALLASVHPGNLLGQEFYAILVKTSNEIIDCDVDKNLTENLASQELYVTKANQFSRYYYGPLIKHFRPMNYAMVATEP